MYGYSYLYTHVELQCTHVTSYIHDLKKHLLQHDIQYYVYYMHIYVNSKECIGTAQACTAQDEEVARPEDAPLPAEATGGLRRHEK